jgi:hypothetical protein
MSPPVAFDDRASQARRVADHLEAHPGATCAELAAACDLGSATKVLSEMSRTLGYGIGRAWRWVPVACPEGTKRRHVRTYTLLHRPALAVQLALTLE